MQACVVSTQHVGNDVRWMTCSGIYHDRTRVNCNCKLHAERHVFLMVQAPAELISPRAAVHA